MFGGKANQLCNAMSQQLGCSRNFGAHATNESELELDENDSVVVTTCVDGLRRRLSLEDSTSQTVKRQTHHHPSPTMEDIETRLQQLQADLQKESAKPGKLLKRIMNDDFKPINKKSAKPGKRFKRILNDDLQRNSLVRIPPMLCPWLRFPLRRLSVRLQVFIPEL
jgi:hypothetical protein